MSSKSKNKRKIAPLLAEPIPVGTPLYRALQEVAKCVAEELAKQQADKPDQHDAATEVIRDSTGRAES